MWEVKLKVVSVCVYITLLLSAVLWHLVRSTMMDEMYYNNMNNINNVSGWIRHRLLPQSGIQ